MPLGRQSERVTRLAGRDYANILPALLLALSLLLGGGGSPAPLLELVLQCLTALICVLWLALPGEPWRQVPRQGWILAGLFIAIPAAQLVPLPPALWHALPGREGATAALDLIGARDNWRPLSLSPSRTLASLLCAAAAAICLLMTASLGRRGRWMMIWAMGGAGLATLLVGAAQMSGGAASPMRFFDAEQSFLTGFQANRNSTADVILIAMLALAALARRARDRGDIRVTGGRFLLAFGALDAIMALGLLLTGSRAGIVLLPLVLTVQFLLLRHTARRNPRRLVQFALAAIAVAGGAIAVLRGNPAITAVLARFSLTGEFRPELWRDAFHALGKVWPAGAGQGTFGPVMMAAERLEVVDQTLPHRAHNDYLELATEAGLAAPLVLGAVAAIVLHALIRARRHPPAGSSAQILFAAGTLTVIALHSLVDYPLRSMALIAVTATAIGLLLPAKTFQSKQVGGS